MNTNQKIQKLKARVAILNAEIEGKKCELKCIKEEIADLEWIRISWEELRNYLLNNTTFKGRSYLENPVVCREFDIGSRTYWTYCILLGEEQRLQIGAYRNNDRFPEGCDLYVKHDYQSYAKRF